MRRQLLAFVCLTFVIACQRSNENTANVGQSPVQPTATETPRQAGPAPTETELRAAIQRTYADVVTVDNSQPMPFIVGDFNGDNSEDIAIVVKPRNGKLSELNSEFTNWILEDAQHPQQPTANVKANEVLLAVIHGHEHQGWRNNLARQTYLLKNVVGTDFARESAGQLKTTGESRSLPQLRGDVIREKLNGSGGIIYWTGAKYAWHPLS